MSLEILKELKSFMEQELVKEDVQLEPSTRLIEAGLIDSLSVVVMLNFISGTYGIEIPLEELTEHNLQTLERIAALVTRMGAQAA